MEFLRTPFLQNTSFFFLDTASTITPSTFEFSVNNYSEHLHLFQGLAIDPGTRYWYFDGLVGIKLYLLSNNLTRNLYNETHETQLKSDISHRSLFFKFCVSRSLSVDYLVALSGCIKL